MIDIDTPMNRAKLVNDTALLETRGYKNSESSRPEKEWGKDARVRRGHGGMGALLEQRGIEFQTDEEHIQNHAKLSDDSQVRSDRRR